MLRLPALFTTFNYTTLPLYRTPMTLFVCITACTPYSILYGSTIQFGSHYYCSCVQVLYCYAHISGSMVCRILVRTLTTTRRGQDGFSFYHLYTHCLISIVCYTTTHLPGSCTDHLPVVLSCMHFVVSACLLLVLHTILV